MTKKQCIHCKNADLVLVARTTAQYIQNDDGSLKLLYTGEAEEPLFYLHNHDHPGCPCCGPVRSWIRLDEVEEVIG